MPRSLQIFLLSICIITLIIIYRMVRKKKILFKHAILWNLLDIILIICIFGVDYLRIVSDFIGMEKISNMIFLFGFLVLLAICIGLTSVVAEQKNKLIILTQEMGILNNKIRKIENAKDKKNNK